MQNIYVRRVERTGGQLWNTEFETVREQLATEVRRNKVEAEIQTRVQASAIEKTPGLDAGLLNRSDLLGN